MCRVWQPHGMTEEQTPTAEPGTLIDRMTRVIAANVRAEVARGSVTVGSVAANLHLSRASAGRRLAGDVPFLGHEIAILARLLGVSCSMLLAGVTDPALSSGSASAASTTSKPLTDPA